MSPPNAEGTWNNVTEAPSHPSVLTLSVSPVINTVIIFLNVLAVSCLRNVLYCNKSIFPVNFEVQIQLHRLQASWFNLVNRLADDILLR